MSHKKNSRLSAWTESTQPYTEFRTVGTTTLFPVRRKTALVSSGRWPEKLRPWAKSTMLNEDYRDILHALSDEKVRFLLIGASMHRQPTVIPGPPSTSSTFGSCRPLRTLMPSYGRCSVSVPRCTIWPKMTFRGMGPSFRSELLQGESTSSLQRPDFILRIRIKGHCQWTSRELNCIFRRSTT